MTAKLKIGQTITATIEGVLHGDGADAFIFTGTNKVPRAPFVRGAEVPTFERTQWAKAMVTGRVSWVDDAMVEISFVGADGSPDLVVLPTDDEQVTFKRPLSRLFSRR